MLNILNPAFANGDAGDSILNFVDSTVSVDKDVATHSVTISVERTGGNTGAGVSCDYSIQATVPNPSYNNLFTLSAGSDYATPNSDFTPVSGTLSWGGNDTKPKTITIPILNNGLVEPNVEFRVLLSNPQPVPGAALGALTWETVRILFDDVVAGQQPAGALDRTWNMNGVSDSDPPFLIYPGTSGGNGGQVYAVATQPDGNTLIAGSLVSLDSNPYNRIVRMLSNGFQDPSFLAAPNSGANDYIATMALQSDGRVVIGGTLRLSTA